MTRVERGGQFNPSTLAACESLVLPLAQSGPHLNVLLAADPSVGVGQPLPGLLLHTEVGTSCPISITLDQIPDHC